MGFNQNYLPGYEEANREALVHNLKEDIINMSEFKQLVLMLSQSDTGLNLVFAHSFADKVVHEMTAHNSDNYQILLNDAVVAIDILNSELEKIVSDAGGNFNAKDVLKPIIEATYRLRGFHPVLRFCEERNQKGVIERVEDMIDSLQGTIQEAESILDKGCTDQDEPIIRIH